MKKRVMDEDITPGCVYCIYSVDAADGEHVLCPRRGVMLKDDSCKKFNPLKRVPRKSAPPLAFQPDDFSLE